MTTERDIILEGWRQWIELDAIVENCEYDYVPYNRVVRGTAVTRDGTTLEVEVPDPDSLHNIGPVFDALCEAKRKYIEGFWKLALD